MHHNNYDVSHVSKGNHCHINNTSIWCYKNNRHDIIPWYSKACKTNVERGSGKISKSCSAPTSCSTSCTAGSQTCTFCCTGSKCNEGQPSYFFIVMKNANIFPMSV